MDNNLKILNFLGRTTGSSFTMLELSKLLKIPYASFYRTIKKMNSLLTIKQIGKAKVVNLNLKNPVIKSYLIISSEERKREYLLKQQVLKKLTGELQTKDVVVLFGSYAKGAQTKLSDIDLLIINKDGKRSLSFSKYELLFRKKINSIVITTKEFKLMLKDKEENVGKQALKNQIILNNPEQFWGVVLDAIQ